MRRLLRFAFFLLASLAIVCVVFGVSEAQQYSPNMSGGFAPGGACGGDLCGTAPNCYVCNATPQNNANWTLAYANEAGVNQVPGNVNLSAQRPNTGSTDAAAQGPGDINENLYHPVGSGSWPQWNVIAADDSNAYLWSMGQIASGVSPSGYLWGGLGANPTLTANNYVMYAGGGTTNINADSYINFNVGLNTTDALIMYKPGTGAVTGITANGGAIFGEATAVFSTSSVKPVYGLLPQIGDTATTPVSLIGQTAYSAATGTNRNGGNVPICGGSAVGGQTTGQVTLGAGWVQTGGAPTCNVTTAIDAQGILFPATSGTPSCVASKGRIGADASGNMWGCDSSGSAYRLADTAGVTGTGFWHSTSGTLDAAATTLTFTGDTTGSGSGTSIGLTTGKLLGTTVPALSAGFLKETAGPTLTWSPLVVGDLPFGTAGQFLTTNSGATAAVWSSCSGDVSCSTSTVGQINITGIATLAGGTVTTGTNAAGVTFSGVANTSGAGFDTVIAPSHATTTGANGNLTVQFASPASGTQRGAIKIQDNSNTVGLIQGWVGTPTAGALYLGIAATTPSGTNETMAEQTNGYLEINAGFGGACSALSTCGNFHAGGSEIGGWTVGGFTIGTSGVLGTGSTIGNNEIGFLNQTNSDVAGIAGTVKVMAISGVLTAVTPNGWLTQLAGTGAAVSTQAKQYVLQSDPCTITHGAGATTCSTINLATSATGGTFDVTAVCRATTLFTGGAVGDQATLRQQVSFRNVSGTLTQVGTTTSLVSHEDTSMNTTALSFAVSGTTILGKITPQNVAAGVADCTMHVEGIIN